MFCIEAKSVSTLQWTGSKLEAPSIGFKAPQKLETDIRLLRKHLNCQNLLNLQLIYQRMHGIRYIWLLSHFQIFFVPLVQC